MRHKVCTKLSRTPRPQRKKKVDLNLSPKIWIQARSRGERLPKKPKRKRTNQADSGGQLPRGESILGLGKRVGGLAQRLKPSERERQCLGEVLGTKFPQAPRYLGGGHKTKKNPKKAQTAKIQTRGRNRGKSRGRKPKTNGHIQPLASHRNFVKG